MWLVRLIRPLLFAILIFSVLRPLIKMISERFRKLPRNQPSCPKCKGTGWLDTGAAVRRACECGTHRMGL